MKLFDSHAHLDMRDYEAGDVRQMLDRAWEAGLVGMVAIAGAGRVGEYGETFAIAKTDRRIYTAAGIHPHAGSAATPDALDKLRFALDHETVVALGEIGLDYHYNRSTPAEQRRAFVKQIRMAHEARLPVVIHTREADADTLSILKDEGAAELGGVIHCFSSALEFANEALAIGFYISFSGVITFPNAKDIRETAKEIPLGRILAETDTPFLAPVPFRGRPNEPANVRYAVEKIAEIRGIEVDETAEAVLENTRRCFGIEQRD